MNKSTQARIATNVLFFLNGMSFASWASRIPDVKEFLKLGDAALGAVLFAMPIGSLSALPVAGIIVSKFGSRRIALFSMLFYIVSMPLIGYANSNFFINSVIKEYFSESMKNDQGEDVSTLEIKKILKTIIEEEDKSKPLPDDRLTEILKEKGYPIARRTIAKYRDLLDIPVARMRKKI